MLSKSSLQISILPSVQKELEKVGEEMLEIGGIKTGYDELKVKTRLSQWQ